MFWIFAHITEIIMFAIVAGLALVLISAAWST